MSRSLPPPKPVDPDPIKPPYRLADRYAGLFPQKGWPARNLQFLRHRLMPGMFRRKVGHVLEPVLDPPEPGKVRITWIGHASFFLQFAGHSVIVDPNWAKWHGPVKRRRHPGLDLHDVPEVDLVLVTHAHFDHLHKPSLRILQAREGIVVPLGSGLYKVLDKLLEMNLRSTCMMIGKGFFRLTAKVR